MASKRRKPPTPAIEIEEADNPAATAESPDTPEIAPGPDTPEVDTVAEARRQTPAGWPPNPLADYQDPYPLEGDDGEAALADSAPSSVMAWQYGEDDLPEGVEVAKVGDEGFLITTPDGFTTRVNDRETVGDFLADKGLV